MFITILCAIAVLVAIGFIAFNPYFVETGYSGDKKVHWGRPAGAILIILALLVFGLFSWTSVSARNVGVLTTFGKPSDRTLDAGFHATWPWQDTTEIDGSVQSKEYEGDDCIYVKIGDGSRSCVTTTINWRIVPEEAYLIYADYRDDDDYDDDPVQAYWGKVLSKQFKAAMQSAFADYNPVAQLETVSGGDQKATDLSFSPDLPFYEARLRNEMKERLGDDPLAEIQSITISYFSFSESTQDTIDQFIEAVGETRITAQGKETAREQKEINDLLAESVSDPNVLVAKCLNLIEQGTFDPPAGFSCWPGGGNSVVIPGTN